MKKSLLTTIFVAAASQISAQEFVFGIGVDNVDGPSDETVGVHVEYRTAPFKEFSAVDLSWMLVGHLDGDGDVYLGAGVHSKWVLKSKWFVEASFAAGYYDEGSGGNDLGGNVQFRSLLGLGYQLSENRSLSLAIDHLSNAGLEDRNPGREAINLRYGISF